MAKVNMRFKGKSPSKMAYEIEAKAKKAVLEQVKVAALEHFDDSFYKQGFDGRPWKARKAPLTGLKSWNNKYSGRAILTGEDSKKGRAGQGGLRGSVKGIIIQRSGIVRIASNKVYAAVHNDGLRAGRGRGFIMPKRQFIGDSDALNRKIEDIIHRNVNPILK